MLVWKTKPISPARIRAARQPEWRSSREAGEKSNPLERHQKKRPFDKGNQMPNTQNNRLFSAPLASKWSSLAEKATNVSRDYFWQPK